MGKMVLLILFMFIAVPSVSFADDSNSYYEGDNRFEYICFANFDSGRTDISLEYFLDTKNVFVGNNSAIVIVYSKFDDQTLYNSAIVYDYSVANGLEASESLINPSMSFVTYNFNFANHGFRPVYAIQYDSYGNEKNVIDFRKTFLKQPYRDVSSDLVVNRIYDYVDEYIKHNPDKVKKIS